MFTQHKSTMLSVNLRAPEAPELQPRLTGVNRDWSRVCTGLQRWDASLRKTLLRCRVRGRSVAFPLLLTCRGK